MALRASVVGLTRWGTIQRYPEPLPTTRILLLEAQLCLGNPSLCQRGYIASLSVGRWRRIGERYLTSLFVAGQTMQAANGYRRVEPCTGSVPVSVSKDRASLPRVLSPVHTHLKLPCLPLLHISMLPLTPGPAAWYTRQLDRAMPTGIMPGYLFQSGGCIWVQVSPS
ncbi:hypothetical protein N656DRAFT_19136 [Canariomyces notabilis]|uniref:Uncharacterized protein n=1 Tax=Canariomyces notabilis TaxID=2074819 RepID=A0AAN6TMD8_9PEZI|nr:hypothetical protein N656DRAFT_19136 [Canariomyces arenarius]